MNPARSLAPALVSGRVGTLWIYLLAPIAGALLAVIVCRVVREDAFGSTASGEPSAEQSNQ